MRPDTTNRPHQKHKRRRLALALLLILAGGAAHAQEATLHMILQPKFMRPDFMFPIEGSEQTILTPALVRGDEAAPLEKADAERLKLDMRSVRRVARASAEAELARLKPEYVRDKNGVSIFALLASDSPATASVVLAPGFAEMFAETLGPDLLVAIPTRHRVYVYPALATRFEETAPLVLRDYETSGYPVSREVFRVTPQGLQAIGAFRTP